MVLDGIWSAQGMVEMLEWDLTAAALPSGSSETDPMFPARLTGETPLQPIGADLARNGVCDDGYFYYCKDDVAHRPVRATEALLTSLAEHCGIAVADFRAVQAQGELLFGSRVHPSTEGQEAIRAFCMRQGRNELGRPTAWKAGYFSRLYAFDVFVGNADRSIQNFVAYRDAGTVHVLAIDFAASTLLMRQGMDFELNGSHTLPFGRLMSGLHGFDEDAALEMVGRLEGVPTSFIQSVVDRMPSGWLDENRAETFLEFWSEGGRSERLARLGAGLKDGSLR